MVFRLCLYLFIRVVLCVVSLLVLIGVEFRWLNLFCISVIIWVVDGFLVCVVVSYRLLLWCGLKLLLVL